MTRATVIVRLVVTGAVFILLLAGCETTGGYQQAFAGCDARVGECYRNCETFEGTPDYGACQASCEAEASACFDRAYNSYQALNVGYSVGFINPWFGNFCAWYPDRGFVSRYGRFRGSHFGYGTGGFYPGRRYRGDGRYDPRYDGYRNPPRYRDQPRRGRPGYDRPRRDRPRYDNPGRDRPSGDRPRRDRPRGDNPRRENPDANRPLTDRPVRSRPRPVEPVDADRGRRRPPRTDRPGRRPPGATNPGSGRPPASRPPSRQPPAARPPSGNQPATKPPARPRPARPASRPAKPVKPASRPSSGRPSIDGPPPDKQ